MTDNLDGLFQNISFDDAYQTTMENEKKLREFQAKGAVMDGNTDIDKEYTEFAKQAIEYQMRFSTDELYALIGRALKEKEETE